VAERIGFANVEFRKGRIQDLKLNLELLDASLKENPIAGVDAFLQAQELAADLSLREPLVPDKSIDVVVSNCVLNLVDSNDKLQLFAEIHRVLRPGGRAVISDIVSDGTVPSELQQDPTLWSGCISGALREDAFIRAFESAGFHGIRLLKRDPKPWRTVAGIDFRSVTVEAYRLPEIQTTGDTGAVVYRGPFKQVADDSGITYLRGERTPVSFLDLNKLSTSPYAEHFEFVGGIPTGLKDDQQTGCC
jgi:SAM-dependent methyltransferase